MNSMCKPYYAQYVNLIIPLILFITCFLHHKVLYYKKLNDLYLFLHLFILNKRYNKINIITERKYEKKLQKKPLKTKH